MINIIRAGTLVVGDGFAAVAAAVTAARHGSRAVLCGRFPREGTAAVADFSDGRRFVSGGFGRETYDNMISLGASAEVFDERLRLYTGTVSMSRAALADIFASSLKNAGVELIPCAAPSSVVFADGGLARADFSRGGESFSVEADAFVDCSGELFSLARGETADDPSLGFAVGYEVAPYGGCSVACGDGSGVRALREIPYSSLLAKNVSNLFRAPSDELASSFVSGQAAGLAAALCVNGKFSPLEPDYVALRRELLRIGAFLPDFDKIAIESYVRETLSAPDANLTKSGKSFPFRSRFQHTLRVRRWCDRLAELERGRLSVDGELLWLAATLHDVGYAFDRSAHAAASEKVCRERLADFGVTEPLLGKVCEVVGLHSSKELPASELSPELRILQDADSLDELGAMRAAWVLMEYRADSGDNTSFTGCRDAMRADCVRLRSKRYDAKTASGAEIYEKLLLEEERIADELDWEV